MLPNYMLFFLMFIPVNAVNSNATLTKTLSTKESPKSESNIPVFSEGGPPILQSSLPLLPNENHTNLLEELAQEEPVSNSVSKIVARKGADLGPKNGTSVHNTKLRQDTTTNHTTAKIKAGVNQTYINQTHVPGNSPPSNVSKLPDMHKSLLSTPAVKYESPHTSEKPVPKKPLVLSFEKLASMDVASTLSPSPADQPKVAAIQSSVKSVVTDQMPSPKSPARVTTKNLLTTSRHPEMVLPVVITMIVVPMFALLGYMALKRGKEAWKNRHYKRMDFLLDGMYNE